MKVLTDEFCSLDNPSSDGEIRYPVVIDTPIPIRRPGNQIRYSYSYSDDWSSEETRLMGRVKGRRVTGRYMRTQPSPWWAACWTGERQRDPWVRFRATLQPKRIQVVRP